IHLDRPGRRAVRPGPDPERVEDRLQLGGTLTTRDEDANGLIVGEVEREDRPPWALLDLLRRKGLVDLGQMDLEAPEALARPERRARLAVNAIRRAVVAVRVAPSRRHLKREVPGRAPWPSGAVHLPDLEAEQRAQPSRFPHADRDPGLAEVA